MQKKQTTTSTLSKLAEYEAPQAVCLSVEIEGVLASSVVTRPPIIIGGGHDDGSGGSGGSDGWGTLIPGTKDSDDEAFS